MATRHRITERVAAPFAGAAVDRAAGVIRGVLVCGTDSANGRRYPWRAALRHAIPLYEGRPVNCDHAGTASVDRRLGWLANPRPGRDGRPRADLHVLRTHPLAARVFEAAERNPALFGLSHVAVCQTRRGGDGVEVVEAIEAVESVDLVADPATTRGLYEHTHPRGTAVPLTVSRLAAALARHPRTRPRQTRPLARLAEADGMDAAPVPGLDAPPPPDAGAADHGAAVDAAFESAGHAVWTAFTKGEIDLAEAIQKLKELAKAHGRVTAAGVDADDSAGDDTDDDADLGPDPAAEWRRRPRLAGLVAEAHAAGLTNPTAADLAVLEEIPSAAARRRVCERVARLAEAEPPRSAGKRPGAGPLPGRPGRTPADVAPPADGKAFARWVSE